MTEQALSLPKPLSLRRYIYLSTLLGVFSEILVVHAGVTIFLFDVVMLWNLVLIWAFLGPIVVPKWLGWFLLYLTASGAIGILRGTDTTFLAAKQLFVIGLGSIYFANFFRLQDNQIDGAWETYAKLAYWLTLIGIAKWLAVCLFAHRFERLQGLTTEPAAYCAVTLPAYYWYAHKWFTSRRHRKEVLWLTLGIALSASSTGFLGVAFGLLLAFGKRRLIALPFALVLICGFGVGLYTISPYVRVRARDTFGAVLNSDVAGTNISTYALISNMFVTERVLEVHPILGNGLGSHILSNHKYISDVPGVELVEAAGWDTGANVQDAASLALRSLSELGLMGFLGILWFIVHFWVGGKSDRAAISCAVMLVFFEKLLRGGGYGNPEEFFFILVYMHNYWQFKQGGSEISASIPNTLTYAD